jgi:hypothetical protein
VSDEGSARDPKDAPAAPAPASGLYRSSPSGLGPSASEPVALSARSTPARSGAAPARTSRPDPASAPGKPKNPALISGAGRSGPGERSRLASGLALAARTLVRLSRLGVSRAKQQGGEAITQFSQRPEHTRQRVYAFGSYAVVVALTLAVQLWEPNSLQAEVKIEPVPLPEATVVFVRNDSTKPWKDVKVTLNGRYGYQRLVVAPDSYISLPVDRFASYDEHGKATYAAKETVPRTLSIDCDRGHFELDLERSR